MKYVLTIIFGCFLGLAFACIQGYSDFLEIKISQVTS